MTSAFGRKVKAARQFLTLIYGRGVPYARARKILPLLERWLDTFQPKGSTGDFVIDFRNHTKLNPEVKEIKGKLLRQTLRDKLINPEYVYLMRTEMGFQHLLSEIGATVNVSEIMRRVSATLRPGQTNKS